MKFGASMFFTDYSMTPVDLAVALEQRGFDIVWAPEHSHIPLSRKTPFVLGGDLPKRYYDAMDPFVTLAMAAAATKTLKIGTGVCLIAQRDPIQTAKLVASIDQVSNGRFVFGIGNGWNQDGLQDAPQARPRAHRGDEGDLDAGHRRIPRRVRRLRADASLAKASAKAASANSGGRRIPL